MQQLGICSPIAGDGARAADVMPDSFAFSAEEATAAEPADAKLAKANFEGKVSLPYDVKCEGKNLKAGQYSLSVKSDGISHVVTLHGSGRERQPARQRTVRQCPSQCARESAVERSNQPERVAGWKVDEGRKVEAVYVKELNRTLYLNTSSQGSSSHMDRLPIS